ncbi:MAG TPA: alpha/beta fold hydrolase [Bryobacteraceae bacterium]|nr:alpha/beta fold hydrolase [Bryobacteraceae bacterium]
MARRIESHMIAGPAGRLEALLEEPEEGEPREAILVCHPHPKGGGTMHNKVIYRIARGLRKSGAVVLRFNFRGVNLSEGEHAGGVGEVDDARAALAWLRDKYPDLPYSLAGFSFGSRVVLRLGCEDAWVRRVVAVGFPTKYKDFEYVQQCAKPKIFLHSTVDEHGPREELQAVFDTLPEPKRLIWIEAEDHFFKGALDPFEQQIIGIGLSEEEA